MILQDFYTQQELQIMAQVDIVSNTAETQTVSAIFPSYPIISLEDGTIRIYGKLMVRGKFYPFFHKGKEYLAHRPKKGIIDIYTVVE